MYTDDYECGTGDDLTAEGVDYYADFYDDGTWAFSYTDEAGDLMTCVGDSNNGEYGCEAAAWELLESEVFVDVRLFAQDKKILFDKNRRAHRFD